MPRMSCASSCSLSSMETFKKSLLANDINYLSGTQHWSQRGGWAGNGMLTRYTYRGSQWKRINGTFPPPQKAQTWSECSHWPMGIKWGVIWSRDLFKSSTSRGRALDWQAHGPGRHLELKKFFNHGSWETVLVRFSAQAISMLCHRQIKHHCTKPGQQWL